MEVSIHPFYLHGVRAALQELSQPETGSVHPLAAEGACSDNTPSSKTGTTHGEDHPEQK